MGPGWCYELRWGFGPEGASRGLDILLVFDTTDVVGAVTAAGPTALAEPRRGRRTRVYDPEPGLVAYPEDRSRTIWRERRFGPLDLRSGTAAGRAGV